MKQKVQHLHQILHEHHSHLLLPLVLPVPQMFAACLILITQALFIQVGAKFLSALKQLLVLYMLEVKNKSIYDLYVGKHVQVRYYFRRYQYKNELQQLNNFF